MDDELPGVHIHIVLPDALTELVKAHVGEKTVHVHLPDGLEQVVRDLGAELVHERMLFRALMEEHAELLKASLTPQIVVQPSPVTVTPPDVRIRPAEVVVHLAPVIKAELGAFRQRLERDPLDGAVTAVVTTPEPNGA
jgi:hypothetical protein